MSRTPGRRLAGAAVTLALALGLASAGCAAGSRRIGEVKVEEGAKARALDPLTAAQRVVLSVGVVTTDIGRGLAFVVDPSGYLLTNRHVVEDADHIEHVEFPAHDPPLRLSSVRVVYIDPERDLALLKIESRDRLPHLPLASRKVHPVRDYLELQDRVLLLAPARDPDEGGPPVDGRELDSGFIAHLGRVRELDVFNDAVGPGPYFGVSSDVQRGQSGGPVLDRYGRAVGIITWTWKHHAGGYAIPISEATAMLSERPSLETSREQLARAERRAHYFVTALERGQLDRARRMFSPSYAREVRSRSMGVIADHIGGDGHDAIRQFVAALEELIGEQAGIEDDDARFARVHDLVIRTGSMAFMRELGVAGELSGDQVVSFFHEFALAYISARHYGEYGLGEALEAALRRLQTLDAARTFAFADLASRIEGGALEVRDVELVPGHYAPRAIVTLARGAQPRTLERRLRQPAVLSLDDDHELVLQLRLEWGDWYVAELQTRSTPVR